MTARAATLVLAGRGKTGQRVAARLAALDVPVRVGSRTGTPPFDWQDVATWPPALEGVDAVYAAYFPDAASAAAEFAIESFGALAVESGVQRLVFLSRRGDHRAERCEAIVRSFGLDWTVLRSSWLAQNFSEGFLLKPLLRGDVALPVGGVREPFVDADDVADVAAAALTDAGHARRVYELTGQRLWTFREAIEEIARQTRRRIRYREVSLEAFAATLASMWPSPAAGPITALLGETFDGRNAAVAAGVIRALGRPPRDFKTYVRETAATGVWNAAHASADRTRLARTRSEDRPLVPWHARPAERQ